MCLAEVLYLGSDVRLPIVLVIIVIGIVAVVGLAAFVVVGFATLSLVFPLVAFLASFLSALALPLVVVVVVVFIIRRIIILKGIFVGRGS